MDKSIAELGLDQQIKLTISSTLIVTAEAIYKTAESENRDLTATEIATVTSLTKWAQKYLDEANAIGKQIEERKNNA